MSLAPIVLFAYNRPEHTALALEALSKNDFADQSELYIYCDGEKSNETKESKENIKRTRAIIREKKWCKSVEIIEATSNFGLAKSVINGVTEVINKHSKIIVLEDDIVTGKHFLSFINKGLDAYEDEKRVYGISGYKFPHKEAINKNTFFLPIMSSWGYATWNDRWRKINFDSDELLQIVESRKIGEKLNFSNLNYYQMLKNQVSGKNDSWAVRFYVSMYLDNGLFLYPNTNLINNIGFDGSGVHCAQGDKNNLDDNVELDISIPVIKQKVRLERDVMKCYTSEKGRYKVLCKKIKKTFKKRLPPEFVQYMKRKFIAKDHFKSIRYKPRYTELEALLFDKIIKVPDNASFLFMYKEIFEEKIYYFKSLKSTPYIIDCGANIGLASIYFKQLYPAAKVIAFEPDKIIYSYLNHNMKACSFTDVELHNKGLWDKDVILPFKSEGADAGLIPNANASSIANDSIEVISLKPYIDRRVDFLKIDIEGAETTVLKNIEDKLDLVDRIFVEYHSFVNQEQTLNEIVEILKNNNFRIYISSPGVTSKSPFSSVATYNNMDMQLNISGIKQSL